MLLKPILALALLATVVSGRRLSLNELLERALDELEDTRGGPQVLSYYLSPDHASHVL